MSEQAVQYVVKEPNPTGIPARWLRFLYRLAKLEAGAHTLVLIVPSDDSDPSWSFVASGKLENGQERKRSPFLGQQE